MRIHKANMARIVNIPPPKLRFGHIVITYNSICFLVNYGVI